MRKQARLLIGISVFWVGLSMLTDGINTLVLPLQLSKLVGSGGRATFLGLLTFVGLLGGALIQPYAGALSDRLRPRLGRRGFIGLGLVLSLGALGIVAAFPGLPGVIVGYVGIQLAASFAQAGQQGLIPDLVRSERRGLASGLKGFMDIAGAMAGFAVLGQLLGAGRMALALAAIAATLVILYAIAVLLTPEDHPTHASPAGQRPSLSLHQALSFDVHAHGAFVRLLLARFLFLLGIYATGRFLLYFIADRLGVGAEQAAGQAGAILAVLALITIIASPLAGWLADRVGRLPMMVMGAILGTASALLIIFAHTTIQILLSGGLMSVGSAAFSGGSWALLADLVPKNESARFFGLANFSTAGSSALAGLLGPVLDAAQRFGPGTGYTILFLLAALAFLASILPLRARHLNEVLNNGQEIRNQAKVGADAARLAIVSVSAHSAAVEEHQDTQAGSPSP